MCLSTFLPFGVPACMACITARCIYSLSRSYHCVGHSIWQEILCSCETNLCAAVWWFVQLQL